MLNLLFQPLDHVVLLLPTGLSCYLVLSSPPDALHDLFLSLCDGGIVKELSELVVLHVYQIILFTGEGIVF